MKKNVLLYPALLVAGLLSACSDGTVSGGGAGDTEDNTGAVDLIRPFVGLYALPENWRGTPTSEAYLDIPEPTAQGVSEALLYEVNAMRNCIEPSRTAGDVTKDPFADRIFFNSFNIGNSILSLEGTDLIISLAADVNDIDNDGDLSEPNTLRATRVINIASASDLGETCE